MPQTAGECAADEHLLELLGVELGDTLTLSTSGDYADALAQDTVTIVGVVVSPLYISVERGTSTLGTGQVAAYMYLPREAFVMDSYTALYLTVEAPVRDVKSGGYDYAALSKEADMLVVRVEALSDSVDNFPVAPLEPLEEVYYALSQLCGQVEADKLSLMLTTTGTAWVQSRQEGTLSAAQIQKLRKSIFCEEYYSARYACAYLTDASESVLRVVWYLDQEAAAQRVRMAAFFGVDRVCLSDLCSAADYEGYSIRALFS